MERRFKLVSVCMATICSYGKDFDKVLNKALGDGVSILRQKEEIVVGAVFYLVHSPKYDLLEKKEVVPNLELDFAPQSPSKILLPQ